VALDGSNLSDYTIGDITIETTNTIGISDTFLFAGENYIQALGGIGDISLSAGGSPAVQSGLFDTGTGTVGELNVQVGSGIANATGGTAGVDFDGDGTIGSVTVGDTNVITAAIENNANYSGGSVSIGDISIDVSAVTGGTTANLDTVLLGNNLLILSGVETDSDGSSPFSGSLGGTNAATGPRAIDADLTGSIGDILIINSSQQLTAIQVTANVTVDNGASGGIFAAGGTIGLVNGGVGQGTHLTTSGNGIILGDDIVTGTTSTLSRDEIIVMFV